MQGLAANQLALHQTLGVTRGWSCQVPALAIQVSTQCPGCSVCR